MKTLLILGCNNLNVLALSEIAKMKGINLIILDGNSNSPGREIANSFECVDITDIKVVLSFAEKYNIDGIFSVNEYGVRSAAYVSSCLDLVGISMATANASLNKGTMREVWKTANIQQPEFIVTTNLSDIRNFAEYVKFPIIIKPLESSGGRGVQKISNYDEIEEAYLNTKTNKVIVEKFIHGTETTVEVLKTNNKIYLIAFSDKPKVQDAPHIAEKLCFPGNFNYLVIEKIKDLSYKIMNSLGINKGIAHIEYLITANNDVFPVEAGARPGGGHIFHPIASHVSGINYPQTVAKLFLGEIIDPQINRHKGACYNFFYAKESGVFNKQKCDEIAAKNLIVEFWKDFGDICTAPKNSLDRLGCIVSLTKTREQALELAEETKNKFSIGMLK